MNWKPNIIGILCLACCLTGPYGILAQDGSGEFVSAQLELLPNGEQSLLKAFGRNHTAAPLYLSYSLEVFHEGSQGKKDTTHSGNFDIKARQHLLLATSFLHFNPGDVLNARLYIFSAGELLATDSLSLRPKTPEAPESLTALIERLSQESNSKNQNSRISSSQSETKVPSEASTKSRDSKTHLPTTSRELNTKNQEQAQVQQTNPTTHSITNPPSHQSTNSITQPSTHSTITIDALIIDDTRSKMAHDFYDLFYRKWVAPAEASDFIIYVKELPSRGRVARVALFVNDDEVIQRMLSPRFDVIEQQVDLCIRVLDRHLKNKASVREQLDQEDTMGNGIF